MEYLLQREDGRQLRVDSDLWIASLDLALRGGWRPLGTSMEAPGWDPWSYVEPGGQRIEREDAAALSKHLLSALENVPDSEIPLRNKPFGAEVTAELLLGAARGDAIPADRLPAAVEVLSGAPKIDARALGLFLRQGSTRLRVLGSSREPL